MSAATVIKAARDLVPGDVIVFNDIGRAAVLRVPNVPRECRDRRLISYGTFNDGIAQDAPFLPDAQFTVEVPAGLTAVQARAGELLSMLRAARDDLRTEQCDTSDIDSLLDELEPPKPPTLDEALALLRTTSAAIGDSTTRERIVEFLARVPK